MKKQQTFVIGDIHGAHKALVQCLKRSKFDYKNDFLFVLGDVVDGWSETPQCIEELLKIKNLQYTMGNHDNWARDWFNTGARPIIWTQQGGQATIDAYIKHGDLISRHKKFFDIVGDTKFLRDEKNRVFVHGGFKIGVPIEKQTLQYLTWDRALWDERHSYDKIKECKEVYVGHTSIYRYSHSPLWHGNVCFMDTGGGWEGKLSIMDVDTKEFWQSDVVAQLYPNELGR